jgi:cellulose synthase/poly-beta-1,6-N-acetylglucosamine synthase-like glycosyltransferase
MALHRYVEEQSRHPVAMNSIHPEQNDRFLASVAGSQIVVLLTLLWMVSIYRSASAADLAEIRRNVELNELLYRDIQVVVRTIKYPGYTYNSSAAFGSHHCEWTTFLSRGNLFFVSHDELIQVAERAPVYRCLKVGFDGTRGWTSEDHHLVTLLDEKPSQPSFPRPHTLLVGSVLEDQSLAATIAKAQDVSVLENVETDHDPDDTFNIITIRNPKSQLIRIWISNKYNYIPSRFEVLLEGTQGRRVLVSGIASHWSEIGPGIWFPFHSLTVNRDQQNADIGQQCIQRFVEKAVLNPPTVPQLNPVTNGRTVHQYLAGTLANEFVQEDVPPHWPRPTWKWMIIVNAIIVDILIGYWAVSAIGQWWGRPAHQQAGRQGRAAAFDSVTWEYIRKHPDDCAYLFVSKCQVACYVVLFELALYLFLTSGFVLFLTVMAFITSLIYVSCIVFRLFTMSLSLSGKGVINVSEDELATLRPELLPSYTILVPLYKEANIAGTIVAHLKKLDYPIDKLDIKLLLEENDTETIEAIRGIALGDHYDVIVVKDSQPKTKPKACNHGLWKARGEYTVIFDAEDQPEPDQLKKAVYAFQKSPSDVVCLQAKLNYRNARQNLLTGWFTIEYTMWFDLLLPGLQRLGAPIPLGGTSNHFKTSILWELGGWDPFNVTEDCDLGIRICKAGFRTQILESTTWEEANSQVKNWINQRSRWIKGFFQTHITHMRCPWQLLRSLGLKRLSYFLLSVGGVSLTQVMNLVFWTVGAMYLALFAVDILAGRDPWAVFAGHRNEYRVAWKMLFWGPGEDQFWSIISVSMFTMGSALFLSNILLITANCLACKRRGNGDLIWLAIVSPIYWGLISIAAWKGLLQLFFKRFYWEKTVHGLDVSVRPPAHAST